MVSLVSWSSTAIVVKLLKFVLTLSGIPGAGKYASMVTSHNSRSISLLIFASLNDVKNVKSYVSGKPAIVVSSSVTCRGHFAVTQMSASECG